MSCDVLTPRRRPFQNSALQTYLPALTFTRLGIRKAPGTEFWTKWTRQSNSPEESYKEEHTPSGWLDQKQSPQDGRQSVMSERSNYIPFEKMLALLTTRKNPGVSCARDISSDHLGGKSHHYFSQNPGCCPVAREEPDPGRLSDAQTAGGSMKPLL